MSNKPARQSLSALAPEQTGQKVFEEALRAAKEANYGAQRRQSKAKARARPRENVARARSSTPNKSHVREKALELWSGVCDVSFRRIASSFPAGIGIGVKKMAKALDSENLYASNEGVKAFSVEGFLRGGLFNALHRAIFFEGSPRKVEEAAMFLDQHGVVLGYSDKNLTALAQDPLPDPVEEAEARRQRRRQALKSWVEIWSRIEAPGRKALLAVCQNWLAEPFEEGGIEHGDWREAVARPGPAEELACRVHMIGQCASAFGSSLTASQWRSVLAEIVAVDNGFQQEEDARGRGFRFGLKKSLRLGLEQPGEPIDVESAGILAAIAVESDDIKLLGLVFERAERVGGLAPSNWWRFVADAEWVGSAENPNHNYQSRQNIHSSERWTSYVARAELGEGAAPCRYCIWRWWTARAIGVAASVLRLLFKCHKCWTRRLKTLARASSPFAKRGRPAGPSVSFPRREGPRWSGARALLDGEVA